MAMPLSGLVLVISRTETSQRNRVAAAWISRKRVHVLQRGRLRLIAPELSGWLERSATVGMPSRTSSFADPVRWSREERPRGPAVSQGGENPRRGAGLSGLVVRARAVWRMWSAATPQKTQPHRASPPLGGA